MNPVELTTATLAYVVASAPFLLLFFALSGAERIIELIYKAFGASRYV